MKMFSEVLTLNTTSRSVSINLSKLNVLLGDEIFGIVFILGLFQAFFNAFLRLDFPVLQLFLLGDLSLILYLKYLRDSKFLLNKYVILAVFILLSLFLLGVIKDTENSRYIFIHLNAVLVFFWAFLRIREVRQLNFNLFWNILFVYCVLSLAIYLFFWDKIAYIIYVKEYGYDLGLRTSGIPRSFGLLFNPLSNGYFLLLCLILYAITTKNNFLFFLLLLISFSITLVRLAFVSYFVFSLLSLIYNRKYLILSIFFVLCIFAYFIFEPVSIVVDSLISMSDEQGSIDAHVFSVFDAIDLMKDSIFGYGFKEIGIESWIFDYAVVYGFMGFLIFMLFYIIGIFHFLFKRNYWGLIFILSFIPVVVGIPFHSFNLPVMIFFLIIFGLSNGKFKKQNS